MKWLDSLLRTKKKHTKLSWDTSVEQNLNKKSHRDIGKRTKIISLSREIFHEIHTEYSAFSWEKLIDKGIERASQIWANMTTGKWVLVIFLIFLSYIVYGLGFLIRTEDNVQALLDNPGQVVATEWQHRIKSLFQDYQIMGFVANNPIFPLEPLATYGNILSHVRAMTTILHNLLGIQSEFYEWRESSHTQSIFPLLDDLFPYLSDIAHEAESIETLAKKFIDSDHAQGFESVKKSFESFIAHQDIWYALLGKNGPIRILLLNQNSDELRAGGGFPWTAFIIEFNSGKLTRFQFYDIYALDWQLKWYRPSPEGINQFRSREYPGKSAEFEIRDANYYPTFHESATKIDELTRTAGIGSVDLVVGINQKFLEDVIKIVEPIRLPGITVPIDHYNAMLVLSMLVEGKKTLTDTPKWTVKTLGDSIFHTLQSEHKMNQALYIFASHIFRGEIIAGSPRADVQKALDDVGIFERWRGKKWDWVYPLFTSISRNKSDRLMERTFEINQVNTCERLLTLSQKHWYDLAEQNRIQDLARSLWMADKIGLLLPVQWGGDNVQYLRFILPPGTKYLPEPRSAFSFLETTELHTSIHGYETTSPGTTSTLKIHYILPEGYCDTRTEFFKQPGLRNTRVVIKKGAQVLYQTFYE